MPETDHPLEALLRKLFRETHEVRAFLLAVPAVRASSLVGDLPGPDKAINLYIGAAVAQLEAHGLLTSDIFAALTEQRPGRAAEIAAVQQALAWRQAAGSGVAERGVPAPKALLRATQPFDQDDVLFGRAMEVQAIETIVMGEEFRFGVVQGRSGCGKTSLLRAGLLPQLRARGLDVVYLARPAELQPALQRLLDNPAGGLLVVDQFEELFLQQPAREAHAELAALIAACIAAPSPARRLLLGIRDDFFGKLHYFYPQVADPTPAAACYELREFTPEIAASLLHASRDSDGTEFEDKLIDAIVRDLSPHGMVRPVELQIVATVLKRQRVWRFASYDLQGHAEGVLRSYIASELAASPDKAATAHVLRRLCDLERRTKARADVSADELAADLREAGLDASSLTNTLTRLRSLRLIVETAPAQYNLVHDYLAPLVIQATDTADTPQVQAAHLLGRYLADYQADPAARIPLRHLRPIRRHARAAVLASPAARRLMRASLGALVAQSLAPLAFTAMLAVLAAYALLASTDYLDTDSTEIKAAGERIVVRSGHPMLKFLPGFDHVVADTSFAMDEAVAAPGESAFTIPSGEIWVFRIRGPAGFDTWIDALMQRLSAENRIITLRLLGDIAGATQSLAEHMAAGRLYGTEGRVLFQGLTDAATAQKTLATLDAVQANAAATAPLQAVRRHLVAASAEPQALAAAYSQALRAYHSAYADWPGAETQLEDSAASERLARAMLDYNALQSLVLAQPDVIVPADAAELFARSSEITSASRATQRSLLHPYDLTLVERMALANAAAARMLLPMLVNRLVSSDGNGDPGRIENKVGLLRMLSMLTRAWPDLVTPAAIAPLTVRSDRALVAAVATGIATAQRGFELAAADHARLKACAMNENDDEQSQLLRGVCALVLLRSGERDAEGRLMQRASRANYLYAADMADLLRARGDVDGLAALPPIQELIERVVSKRAGLQAQFDLEQDHSIYEIGRANPLRLSDSDVDLLLEPIQKAQPLYSASLTDSAGFLSRMLFDIARWRPQKVLASRAIFADHQSWAGRSQDDLRHREVSLAILARADYESRRTTGVPSEADITKALANRTDYAARIRGVYAAYLRWLEAPDRRAAISALLAAQAERPEPELRIAANLAREMIRVGEQTEVGGKITPGLALARLRYFQSHAAVHIHFAARLSMERWIEATDHLRRKP